jgi:hypothetical protein
MRHSGRNEIFHNIGGVLREGVPMRSRAIQEHGRHDPIRLMHRALRHPGDLSRVPRDLWQSQHLGCPVKEGQPAGEHRMAQLMRQDGIRATTV